VAATKTTLYLPDGLRARLKAEAARRDTTISALLAEGAQMVLARGRRTSDREDLLRRAREAELELRRGLYTGGPAARDVDELVYSHERERRGRSRSAR